MHNALQNFKQLYSQLAREPVSESLLRSAYRDDIRFIDPVHNLSGITAMQQYLPACTATSTAVSLNFSIRLLRVTKRFYSGA